MGGFAWVTLATDDSYSLGALVLGNSLKRVGTQHQLVVLITPGVTNSMRERLSSVFNLVQEVNILDSKDEANLRLLQRPELGITFTKLHCWRLTQFDKCVFLDADTLVLQNCDELFEREEFSAAPDVGWPDCFNSGVFVYHPSNETYEKLIQFAIEKGSFDGGDQGLLNLYFSDWATKDISKHLPFIYNMCSVACYSYLPAFKQFGYNARIVHFIGIHKPWFQYVNTETRRVQTSPELRHLEVILQRWWNIFFDSVLPQLTDNMGGIAAVFAELNIGGGTQPNPLEDFYRRQGWEVGKIDYLGKDSFDNIWSKICETIDESKPTEATPAKAGSPPKTTETPKPEVSQKSPETQSESTQPTKETPVEVCPVCPIPKDSPPEAPKAEVCPKGSEPPAEVCPVCPIQKDSPPKAPKAEVCPKGSEPPAEVCPVSCQKTETPESVEPPKEIICELPKPISETPKAVGVEPSKEIVCELPKPPTQTSADPAVKNVETPKAEVCPKGSEPAAPKTPEICEKAAGVEPSKEIVCELPKPPTQISADPAVKSVETPKSEVCVKSSEPVVEASPKCPEICQKAPTIEPSKEVVCELPKPPTQISAEPAVKSVETPKAEVCPKSSEPVAEASPKTTEGSQKVEPPKEIVCELPKPPTQTSADVSVKTPVEAPKTSEVPKAADHPPAEVCAKSTETPKASAAPAAKPSEAPKSSKKGKGGESKSKKK